MSSSLAWGTVGWQDDQGKFYDLGSDQDDGSILVRVTLFRGRGPNQPLAQGGGQVAQGQQLLCKVASSFVQVPPRGSRVLVAIPEPFGMVPGGSLILAADNPNPNLIGNLKPGEAAVTSADGKGRILLKKETDAIVLYTEDSSGGSVSLYVGKDKIQMSSATGSITIDSSGVSILGASGGLTMTADGTTTLSGTFLNLFGQIASLGGQLATCIGQGCVPTPGANNAIYGPVGLAGLPAARVYIAPA